jgi:hypothetical protein
MLPWSWRMRGHSVLMIRQAMNAAFALVAQTLAGTALAGKKEDGPEHAVATTPAEQAALKKLVANWRTLIESSKSDRESKTRQQKLFT